MPLLVLRFSRVFLRTFCVCAAGWLCAINGGAFAASDEAIHGTHGMVASRSLLASQVGVAIMQQGGNAIDAAVATGFALAVTYPSAGNLGGGGFMVIRLADGTVIANDHREVAPAKSSKNMFLDAQGNVVDGLSTHSHLAVGVPGSVDGLLSVLERYGKLSRAQVLAPAIKLAKEGFPLNYDLARQFADEHDAMQRYPASLAVFARPDGTPWQEGDIWKQPDLAKTLTRIAKQGRAGFYEGPVADLIAAEMTRGRGLISKTDLQNYRSKFRDVVKGTYRGYEVFSMPPPSSGGVLLVQMLNMLEGYDVKGMGFGSANLVHLMVEVERRAYADRAKHLGDPDFFAVPIAHLIAKDYAKQRLADFDANKATPSASVGAGKWPEESQNTTHASFVDAAGNAVAYTTTLNLSYGCKIIAAGTGVLLNDEMDDFSVKPRTPNSYGLVGDVANEVQPGKRMLSSMTPTIVTKDGKLVLVTGSPGGSTIITTVLQVIVNTLDHGMDISNAVGMPRVHSQWQPDRVAYEPFGLSPDTLAILKARGHTIVGLPYGRGFGDANSISVQGTDLWGMHDPRDAGGAAGY